MTPSVAALLLLLAAWAPPPPGGVDAYIVQPGPKVRPTRGQPWPMVQKREQIEGYMIIRPSVFRLKVKGEDCDLLQDAFKRYHRIILLEGSAVARAWRNNAHSSNDASRDYSKPYKPWAKDPLFHGYLDSLDVQLLDPCESMPHLGMDEQYELMVNRAEAARGALLRSQSIWGALRGLETFSQLVFRSDDGAALIINSTHIQDFPRFSHRGLHLDTARHFLPVNSILETLNAMEANKLNVFHWHIVDDQSFPFQSKAFPLLSEKGAYDPRFLIYTHDDIRMIIEYARLRGIRVIPEFDTPGHTRSWGEGLPDLLTACYMGEEPDGTYGPINPTRDSTYHMLSKFFKEVVNLFPDKYIHLGGDEVSFECWASNPEILSYMTSRNMSGQFALLESIYIEKLIKTVQKLNASYLVWQEVLDEGVDIPMDTIVHIWIEDHKRKLSQVTKDGYSAILSSCWYLDHINKDWTSFYACDPHDFDGTEKQKKLVLGGEACMWGEMVDETNLMSRVWPRASAAAEKLWSKYSVKNINDAARRIEEHTCRMRRRGIPAQPPNGPSYCPI